MLSYYNLITFSAFHCFLDYQNPVKIIYHNLSLSTELCLVGLNHGKIFFDYLHAILREKPSVLPLDLLLGRAMSLNGPTGNTFFFSLGTFQFSSYHLS